MFWMAGSEDAWLLCSGKRADFWSWSLVMCCHPYPLQFWGSRSNFKHPNCIEKPGHWKEPWTCSTPNKSWTLQLASVVRTGPVYRINMYQPTSIHLWKALFDRIDQHGGGGRPSFRLMAEWFLQSAADVLAMADADSRRDGVSRCELGFWSVYEAWIFILCCSYAFWK